MAEVRLIDANAFKRDLIDNWDFYSVLMKNALERQPTIDAVPVVRCKDCAFYVPSDRRLDEPRWCELSDDGYHVKYQRPNDFCSCGERREDNAAD